MRAAALLALALAAFPLSAVDFRPGGGLTATASAGHWSAPEWTALRLRLDGELTMYHGPVKAFVQADVLSDPRTAPDPEFTLGEAWSDVESGRWNWRVGRQRISWGQGLALPVLDLICPQDYRGLADGEDRDGRIPVTGLDLRFSAGVFIAEAVWIPVFAPAVLPGGPLPGLPAGMAVRETEVPDLRPENGEWAARVRFFLPFGDLGVMAYYGWDDVPASRIDLVPQLVPSHERLLATGLDTALPVGPLLVRIEAGMFWNRAFSVVVPGEPTHRSHQGAVLAGLDWRPSDWIVTLESYFSTTFTTVAAMGDPRDRIVLAGEISRSFASGDWQASLGGTVEVLEGDWLLNPEIVHRPADGLEIAAGSRVLVGNGSIFAYFEDGVTAYARLHYRF